MKKAATPYKKNRVDHLHILGASGSGTSTLGAALAKRFGYVHLDTDAFFWEPTDPPFQIPREESWRQTLLGEAVKAHPKWVLSGSLCGWGDLFIPLFDLVIFLFIPQETRLARLRSREQERYGQEALAPGGKMHGTHEAFMNWAAAYDEGGEDMRSLRRHELWLAGLDCPCLRFQDVLSVEELVARVEEVFSMDGVKRVGREEGERE